MSDRRSRYERMLEQMDQERQDMAEALGIVLEPRDLRDHSRVLMQNNPRPRPPDTRPASVDWGEEGYLDIRCACELIGDDQFTYGEETISVMPDHDGRETVTSDPCWRCGTVYRIEPQIDFMVRHGGEDNDECLDAVM